jgi:hypothetical protein
MSDRRVVYKTPFQRVSETLLVFSVTLGVAAAWHGLMPTISASYPIIASLALGYLVVPFLGSRLALSRGASLMTAEERSRRYLSEIGPIGFGVRPGIMMPQRISSGRRRPMRR